MFSNIRDKIKNAGADLKGKSLVIRYETIIIALVFLFTIPDPSAAWPQESQWNVVLKNGLPLSDPSGDASDGKDVVGNLTYPCCYLFNNGSALFFRLRVNSDPSQGSGLKPYGWGIEIDSNANFSDYEWLILIDGILDPETVTIERNTIQSVIGDPSDQPEYINKTYIPTIGDYVNLTNAGRNFGITDDYFISWFVPYADFRDVTDLDNFSALRVFFGTSSSTHALVPNGADLVEGSDLFTAGSDWISPMGTVLTNGSINFVNATYDQIVFTVIPGDPVYIRVIDPDQNTDNLSIQTLEIGLISSRGDSLNITLTESGISSDIFIGSAETSGSAPVLSDPILQVELSGTINAIYNDTNNLGQYILLYSTIDVLNVTNDPPVITLLGSSPVTIELGSIYIDAGATALDDIDGDITDLIITANSVDNTTVGTYNVTYDVTDSSGNPAVQVIRTVNLVDTTPPLWIPVPSDRIIEYGSNLNYDVNATDQSTPVIYGVNDTTNFTMNVSTGSITNKTALNLGNYYLNIIATDTSLNSNSSIIRITVQDTIAPVWDPIPVNQTIEFGTLFSYDVNATDPASSIIYSINDTLNFSINPDTGLITNNTMLNMGSYGLTITATDASNNSNNSVIIVTVQYPPETTIISAPPAFSNSASANFSFSSNKPGTFECRLEIGEYSLCSSPKEYTGLGDGTHIFYGPIHTSYVSYILCILEFRSEAVRR